MSDEPEQVTLAESPWESAETASTSNSEDQQETVEQSEQEDNSTQDRERRRTTQQPFEAGFTFRPDDLPEASQALNQTALDTLLVKSPNAPLEDAVTSVTNHSPMPTSDEQRTARALYIFGRAQMGALNGYDLSTSMIQLRDCIEDELGVSTTELVENGYLRKKRLDGRWVYYRLTTAGRRYIEKADHPTFDLLRPGVERPIVGDGGLHNFGVLLGADWLLRETEIDSVAQPELDTKVELDLGGYIDGKRRWIGEVVAHEDAHSDSSGREEPADTFLKRIRHLESRPEHTLLVFESSPVAVRAIHRLDTEGILDLPGDIDYRQYSIAQLRKHLLPEIDHSAFEHVESIATLLEGR